ncbi:MAG: ABC transporter substrate-binding protein [Methyloversatilis discipulorum]|uniref:ABC transporter substrate-binding protein n=1 Tax=Methyloversatilis discipulorum TaxID=1119528 RepID=UPI0026F00782|nr:ABC transporter substrate-binding protein [Methyloversatilis discipulorum]MBT9516003.1 ABC transporter substrate-binding protein [Methyloversatilis discipulorum]
MSDTKTIDGLWYTRCPVPTPLGLAARQGWLDDEFRADGLTLRTLQDTVDPELRESHYDHRLPHSFRQGGNVPAIWARSRGSDTRVIGLNWVNEAQLILVRPDSGLRTPADLAGKRIGVPVHGNSIDHQRASALRGITVALSVGGLKPEHATLLDLTVPARPLTTGWNTGGGGYATEFEALETGKVDAIFVKGARGLQAAVERGAHILYDLRSHPDLRVRANNGAPRPITVDAALIDARPDLVVRFLRRIVDIGEWAKAHPAETVAYIARESGSTDDWVREAYGADIHLHQGTDLDPAWIEALDGYKNFLLEWGFIPADFDVQAWIDPAPLAEVGRQLELKVA